MKKAVVISKISEGILQGRISLENLRELPDEEVILQLTALKGIGHWTAEMLLINCMERPNVVSWGGYCHTKRDGKVIWLSEADKAPI